jgi:hypothetical protein
MRGREFEILLPEHVTEERHEPILDAVRRAAEKELDREVSVHLAGEAAGAAGGLIVRREDGQEICEQTFEARMERLWPQIRREIAYDLLGERSGGSRERGTGDENGNERPSDNRQE